MYAPCVVRHAFSAEFKAEFEMATKSAPADAPTPKTSGVVEEKGKLEAGFLEEDDEFEEFPAEDWEVGKAGDDEEEEETNIWEDNWDDEIQHDDFAKQLQEELQKVK